MPVARPRAAELSEGPPTDHGRSRPPSAAEVAERLRVPGRPHGRLTGQARPCRCQPRAAPVRPGTLAPATGSGDTAPRAVDACCGAVGDTLVSQPSTGRRR